MFGLSFYRHCHQRRALPINNNFNNSFWPNWCDLTSLESFLCDFLKCHVYVQKTETTDALKFTLKPCHYSLQPVEPLIIIGLLGCATEKPWQSFERYYISYIMSLILLSNKKKLIDISKTACVIYFSNRYPSLEQKQVMWTTQISLRLCYFTMLLSY